jgi:hypothetical protein
VSTKSILLLITHPFKMKTIKNKLKLPFVITALSVLAFMGSCKKDTYLETKGLCPTVVSTNPANLATNVPLNQTITVTFNEKMNPATINDANFSFVGDAKLSGTMTYNESNFTMSFVPQPALATNKSYTGKVSTRVKDLNGNALQKEYIWTFGTGVTLAPIVVSTDPSNGATGVVLNKTITATFNMAMDPNTINGSSFLVKNGTNAVNGNVSYVNNIATFVPAVVLTSNTVYSATLTSAAKNTLGVSLAANYTWTFTTGLSLAPTVIATDPINNATSVPLNKIITATFSEAMDPSTINGSSFLLKQGAVLVTGNIIFSGSVLSFVPASGLSSGSVYTATITTAAKNLSGNNLVNDYVWSFSTLPSLGAPLVDLKSVGRFGIIAGVGVSNNAGFSEIHDLDVGISPGVRTSITGFPPAVIINGASYASDDLTPPGTAAMLIQAKQDLTDAYLFAEGATSPAPAIVSGDLGGQTLAPGIYKSNSTLLIQSGDLTLDAQGDPNAVWIFQIASAFTTVGGAGGNIILTGGAQAKNIFWQTGSSATIGDFTSFKGNILALTSITMNTAANAVGRMLARNGSVVMTSSNIINKP